MPSSHEGTRPRGTARFARTLPGKSGEIEAFVSRPLPLRAATGRRDRASGGDATKGAGAARRGPA